MNYSHEHYREFNENENMDIWIGALGDLDQYSPAVVEEIETIFIAMYGNFLTENERKQKKSVESFKDTVCIINLWYDIEEKPLVSKRDSIKPFHDVIVYERDGKCPRYIVANRLSPWEGK
jgi:hypothetical protein